MGSVAARWLGRAPGGSQSWLNAMPHPPLACEIAAGHVAAARWSRGRRRFEGYDALLPLPPGVVVPSLSEQNIAQADSVVQILRRVLDRAGIHGPETALLVPDQVVRVFLLHFGSFPRRAEEAIPMLRWRLKKSVPFDVEDTVISFVPQPARGTGIEVVTAVGRRRVIREYEEVAEKAGLAPGIVVSSTLATLPLIEEAGPVLLARMAGTCLTTAIVRGPLLCVYRCSGLDAEAADLAPQELLDEIFPMAAYFQDTWKEPLQQVRLAGLGTRLEEFRMRLEEELRCPVAALAAAATLEDRLTGDTRAMVDRQMDSLVGWMMNHGA